MRFRTSVVVALLGAALLAGGALSAANAFAGGSTYSVIANLRAGEVMPANDSTAAEAALAHAAGASSLDTLTFHITLPSTDATGHMPSQATSRVKAELVGGGANIIITFNAAQSYLTTGTLDGQTVTYGELTGTALISPGDDVPCTVGVVSIPSASESHFTFALDAHDGVPPLAVSFGNLAPSQALVNLVTSHQ